MKQDEVTSSIEEHTQMATRNVQTPKPPTASELHKIASERWAIVSQESAKQSERSKELSDLLVQVEALEAQSTADLPGLIQAAKEAEAAAQEATVALKTRTLVQAQPERATLATPVAPKAPTAVKAAPKGDGKPANLPQRMAQAMGKQTMDAKGVLAALQAKGWAPASKNPLTYLGSTLGQEKDLFERVSKGFYKVKGTAAAAVTRPAPQQTTATKPTAAPKTTNGKLPALQFRMAKVMGKKDMSAKQILEALQAKGWAPAGNNAGGTISATLSKRPEFQKVSHGVYRYVPAETTDQLPTATPEVKAAPAAPKAAPAKAANTSGLSAREKVQSGLIPPFRERIAIVLGDDVMGGKQILDALAEHGQDWVPETAKPLNYLSMMLTTNPEFVRVARGQYKLDKSKIPAKNPTGVKKVKASATNGVQNRSKAEVDAGLADFGPENVADNPFEASAE